VDPQHWWQAWIRIRTEEKCWIRIQIHGNTARLFLPEERSRLTFWQWPGRSARPRPSQPRGSLPFLPSSPNDIPSISTAHISLCQEIKVFSLRSKILHKYFLSCLCGDWYVWTFLVSFVHAFYYKFLIIEQIKFIILLIIRNLIFCTVHCFTTSLEETAWIRWIYLEIFIFVISTETWNTSLQT